MNTNVTLHKDSKTSYFVNKRSKMIILLITFYIFEHNIGIKMIEYRCGKMGKNKNKPLVME